MPIFTRVLRFVRFHQATARPPPVGLARIERVTSSPAIWCRNQVRCRFAYCRVAMMTSASRLALRACTVPDHDAPRSSRWRSTRARRRGTSRIRPGTSSTHPPASIALGPLRDPLARARSPGSTTKIPRAPPRRSRRARDAASLTRSAGEQRDLDGAQELRAPKVRARGIERLHPAAQLLGRERRAVRPRARRAARDRARGSSNSGRTARGDTTRCRRRPPARGPPRASPRSIRRRGSAHAAAEKRVPSDPARRCPHAARARAPPASASRCRCRSRDRAAASRR